MENRTIYIALFVMIAFSLILLVWDIVGRQNDLQYVVGRFEGKLADYQEEVSDSCNDLSRADNQEECADTLTSLEAMLIEYRGRLDNARETGE